MYFSVNTSYKEYMEERISMVHGSGGAATSELIGSIFAKEFASTTLDKMEDSAVVEGAGRIAMTTDSFVVTPVSYPGGDIGRLCICGRKCTCTGLGCKIFSGNRCCLAWYGNCTGNRYGTST